MLTQGEGKGAATSSLGARIVAHRRTTVALVALAFALVTGTDDQLNRFDPPLFLDAGDRLLSGGWRDLYSNPDIQAGPLLLLFFGLVARLAAATGLSPAAVLSVSVQVPLAVGISEMAYAAFRHERAAAARALAAGLAAPAVGVTWTAFQTAQPADAVVPLLWSVAAWAAVRGRAVTAGAAIGAGVALKAWAILALPLVLLSPDVRNRIAGGAVAVGIPVLTWGPFLVFGTIATFSFRWPLWAEAPIGLLLPGETLFPWHMRLVQAALVAGLGTVLALRYPRNPDAWWLIPLALAGARIALDPTFWYWYWLGIDVPAIFGIAALARPGRRRGDLVIAGLLVVVLFLPPGGFAGGAAAAALATVALARSRGEVSRSSPASATDPPPRRTPGRRRGPAAPPGRP